MRKPLSLMFLVVFALCSASCSGKGENTDKKKLEEAKSKYLLEIVLRNGSDELISLLAVKYRLNMQLTRKIIDQFTGEDSLQKLSSLSKAKTVEELDRLKTRVDRSSVEERIRKISVENNIEQSVIASLLIDYKIWYEAHHDETH